MKLKEPASYSGSVRFGSIELPHLTVLDLPRIGIPVVYLCIRESVDSLYSDGSLLFLHMHAGESAHNVPHAEHVKNDL